MPACMTTSIWPSAAIGEDRHVREDEGPRRVLAALLGAMSAATTSERRRGEPDGQEARADERVATTARAPVRRPRREPVALGAGPRASAATCEELAPTRCPFCARSRTEVSTITERTARPVFAPNASTAAATLRQVRSAPALTGSSRELFMLAVHRGGVEAAHARVHARQEGERHELAAPVDPQRLRRLDGSRPRRHPERGRPRRGRRRSSRSDATSASPTRRRSTRPG